MNTIEGIDRGNVAVRKIVRNLGIDAQFEIHLGGSLEHGNSLVVLTTHSMEALDLLYAACQEIETLEVNE